MKLEKLKPFLALSAGIILQVCLGGIYAWSAFVPSLRESFGFSSAETQLVFGLSLISHTTSMIFVGKIIKFISYRKLIYLSAFFTASGYVLAGYYGQELWALLAGIGVLNGIGIACGYLCAIQNGVNWFKQKGLVTGIAVAGYGGGAILLSLIVEWLLAKNWSILQIFKIVGLSYGFLILLTSIFFFQAIKPQKIPRDFYRQLIKVNLPVRDPRLWALIFAIMLGSYPGLALIGNIKPIALYYKHSLVIASTAISFIAIGNASGRIIWGNLQDKLGNLKTTITSLLAIALSVLFLCWGKLNAGIFLFACFWIGFSFGACLSIYAAQTATFFGTAQLSEVYPFVLWFYGLAALFGPWVTGLSVDLTGSYYAGFIFAFLLPLVGLIFYLKIFLKNEQPKQ